MVKNLIKSFNWATAFAACWTIIFSPLAIGKEAEKLNKQYLQNTVVEFGLNKKSTLGDFWEKSKRYIPGYVYKDLEQFVSKNKNMQMPEVSVDVSQSTEGEVPVMTFTQNGKTTRIQFFGEKNKWAKINGVTVTASDLNRIQDVYKRLEASDIKLKNEADRYRKSMNAKQPNLVVNPKVEFKKDFSRFSGFPRITPHLWKSMTREQRAGYIIKMRLMWMSARKVLAANKSKYGLENGIYKNDEYTNVEKIYQVIFGIEANAAGKAVTPSATVQVKGTSVQTAQGDTVSIPYTAKTCVVAGYIGAYGKVDNINGDNRDGCSIDVAIATYKSNENLKFIQEANDECAAQKSTMVACNPIIYGYPNGKPACIDRRSPEYQHATHFESNSGKQTCDGKSRLSSSEDIIKFNEKDYSNIQPREKQIAAIEADQQKEDFALTKNFINGMLNKRDPILLALFEKGEWNSALDNELIRIQTQFEQEIDRAIKTCEADILSKHEKNQKPACDQLHRRWIFTEKEIVKLRDKACVKPAKYAGGFAKETIDPKGTNLCECPADEKEKDGKPRKVNFGQSCTVAPVNPDGPPVKPVSGDVTEPTCPASGDNTGKDCKSSDDKKKCDTPEGVAGYDYEQCKCSDNKKLEKNKDGKYECEGTNWLPWVLGGLGIVALFALFHKKKKDDTPKPPPPPPPPVCNKVCAAGVLNPTTCSCDIVPPPPVCQIPKVGTPPNCQCPSVNNCTVGQQVYDTTTCQCTNLPQPPVCADNSLAPNGNLAKCPTCPDGSFKTTAGCPTEGGGGNNCPQGGCSGGLPGTGK